MRESCELCVSSLGANSQTPMQREFDVIESVPSRVSY